MSLKLNEALQRATEFTRSRKLGEATAAIQQALARGLPPVLHKGLSKLREGPADRAATAAAADVIDVEARVVPGARDDFAAANGRSPQSADSGAAANAPPKAKRPAAGDTTSDASWPAPGRFIKATFANGAGQRDYKLYRPTRQPADGVAPALLVMLHGCTQNPDDFAAGTRMNERAEALGWWVLYPAQSSAANGSGCWNWFKTTDQQRGSGEPAILAGMTRSVIARAGIDPKRVFVAGLSAGGAMAVTLAATHADLFAAAGVHSGLPHGSAHDLMSALTAMRQGGAGGGQAHAVPTIVFHGDQDSTVHPCNGTEVIRQSRSTARATGKAAAEGPFETEQATAQGGHRYTRTLHRNAGGRVDAEHWLVHGAGHAWSGGSSAGTYTDPSGPDASAEMLRFFQEHRSA